MTMRRMLILMIAVIGMFGSDAFAIYAPSTGRFMQRDPIGYKDGMNLYQYAGSSPNNFGDPYGLFAFRYDSTFTDQQSDRLDESRERICNRLNDLNDQMDAMSECMKKELFKGKGKMRGLRKKLRKMKKACARDDFRSPLSNEVYFNQRSLPNSNAESRLRPFINRSTGLRTTLSTNPSNRRGPWTTWSDETLDTTIFHELMHWAEGEFGKNKDGDFVPDDAHVAERLMTKNFDELPGSNPISVAIDEAKKSCGECDEE